MNLAKLFKESIDLEKENDDVFEKCVEELGDVVKSLNVGVKTSKVRAIHKMLKKTLIIKKRIKKVQSKLSKEMLVNHKRIGDEFDE